MGANIFPLRVWKSWYDRVPLLLVVSICIWFFQAFEIEFKELKMCLQKAGLQRILFMNEMGIQNKYTARSTRYEWVCSQRPSAYHPRLISENSGGELGFLGWRHRWFSVLIDWLALCKPLFNPYFLSHNASDFNNMHAQLCTTIRW